MSDPSYFDAYKNLAMSRHGNGVLTVRFHTDGGPIVFTGQTHEDFPQALEEISLDGDNRAVVLTGTGDVFMDQIDGPSLGEIFKPAQWETIRAEGLKVLQRLAELPLPVVGVANGPATVHVICTAGTTASPTTQPATTPSSASSATKIQRRLDTGHLMAATCTGSGTTFSAHDAPPRLCEEIVREGI